jgi:hypothetical protein
MLINAVQLVYYEIVKRHFPESIPTEAKRCRGRVRNKHRQHMGSGHCATEYGTCHSPLRAYVVLHNHGSALHASLLSAVR